MPSNSTPARPLRPAVFLDRDGTINVEVNYLRSPDELRLIEGAAESIQQLRAAGFLVIVITNQSGIARGFFTHETLDAIHRRLCEQLAAHGAAVDAIYVCTHHPDDHCDCRKPGSSLYLQAAREHGIDLGRSLMIGDKDTDLLAAKQLHMPSVLVKTGFGLQQVAAVAHWTDYQPVYIADDLRAATGWVLSHFSADSRG